MQLKIVHYIQGTRTQHLKDLHGRIHRRDSLPMQLETDDTIHTMRTFNWSYTTLRIHNM